MYNKIWGFAPGQEPAIKSLETSALDQNDCFPLSSVWCLRKGEAEYAKDKLQLLLLVATGLLICTWQGKTILCYAKQLTHIAQETLNMTNKEGWLKCKYLLRKKKKKKKKPST